MRLRSRSGVVLVYTFIVMLMVSIVASAFLFMAAGRGRAAAGEAARLKAFWLAEAGAQQAKYRMRTDAAYRASPSAIPATGLGEGTYAVAAVKAGAVTTFTATGTVGGISRSVRVTGTDSVFFAAGFAGGSAGGTSEAVTMSGGSYTDSYNSALGAYNIGGNIGNNGDMVTNADIGISGGNTHIGGDAVTGPGGVFSDQTAVSGTISRASDTAMPSVVVPSLSWTGSGQITTSTTLNAGNHRRTQVNLKSGRVLRLNPASGPINLYLTGAQSIDLGGGALINVTTTVNPVKIYVNGSIDATGGGAIRNTSGKPALLQIYGTDTSTSISLSGGTASYFTIYAPRAALNLSGGSPYYGAFVGDTVRLVGGSAIHYDEAVAGIVPPTSLGVFKETDWHAI